MKKIIVFICLLTLVNTVNIGHAQEERNHGIIWSSLHGLEYEIKAGINIGGATPLPLPQEIRALTGYNPNIYLSIEGNITKWFTKKKNWGMTLGIRIENKGMEADARVKNYSMEIIGGGGERLSGNWTGDVKTKFRAAYFSIPVLATYQLSNRVRLSAGPYISFKTNGDFNGYVSEGYLRKEDPTGTKVEFTGDNTAPYDFSDDLRSFQWGVQAGASWRAFKRLTVHGDITWGLNNIINKDFQTITFNMYPIYLNVGFGYAF